MLRFLRIVCECVAAIIGVTIVLGALLIWRLNNAPIRSDILTPYLSSTIEREIPGSQATIASSAISWDAKKYSIALHIDAVHVSGADGKPIADIPSIGGRIGLLELLDGKFLPTELVIDHPQVWINRQSDGTFSLGTPVDAARTGNFAKGAKAKINTSPALPDVDFNQMAERAIDMLAHAYVTNKLSIARVAIVVHDETAKLDWAIYIPEINLRRAPKGLAGMAQIELSHGKAKSTLEINYAYDRDSQSHTLSTHLQGINPSSLADDEDPFHPSYLAAVDLPISGELSVTVNNQLSIEAVSADLEGGTGNLNWPEFWDKQRGVQNLRLNFSYDRKSGKLMLPLGIIDLGGPKVVFEIEGSRSIVPNRDMDFVLNATFDHFPMDQTNNLWPKPLLPDLRDWIATNMHVGTFDHTEGIFKGSFSWNDLNNIAVTEGNGKLSASHVELHYIDTLPPVLNVDANATFNLKQITVNVTNGNIDNIHVEPFQLVITGLLDVDQYIDIPLNVAGPIPDVMRLIDHKPLEYAHALGLTSDGITGNVTGIVSFHFPLLKALTMKDVDIKVTAQFTDVASTKLVPGIALAQGNLTFDLTKDGFKLAGPITANKILMQVISWDQKFESVNGEPVYKASISGVVNGDQWPNIGIDLFKGSEGPSNISLDLTQLHESKLMINGLVDMTSADMHFNTLSWKKAVGVPAALTFSAELPVKGNIHATSISFTGKGLSGKGSGELERNSKKLLSLTLSPLVIGRTNATVHIEPPSKSRFSVLYDIKGRAFDMSGIRGTTNVPSAAYDNAPPDEYHINVDSLMTSETGFIAHASGTALHDNLGWNQVDLHGLAQGDHQLDIEIKPKDEIRTLAIQCDDFGKALQGMGLTDAVREGVLDIHGESTPEHPRVIQGVINIGYFQVKDLPVLAQLLNATSPFGWVGIVTNSVNFDRLRGNFRWDGDRIDLTETNAAGSAVGINIEGNININNGDANLHGTIVPFSMMNHVINYIPILGNIITGGKDQGVFAVTYGIKGALNNPSIHVNPASLLTPGFLRNLFFGVTTSTDNNKSEDPSKTENVTPIEVGETKPSPNPTAPQPTDGDKTSIPIAPPTPLQ